MSSRTNIPIWRTARTLTLMFWAGLCLAPLSALLLLIGNSGTVIKLSLIVGLGSIVLIGLSVTWRKDAGSVERELSTALSDVEADTHQMIAELRTEVRSINRSGAPPPAASRHEMEPERAAPRPRPEVSYEANHQAPPPRRAEYDREPEPARRGYSEQGQPGMQRRRSEAAYEDTGEMGQQYRRREEYPGTGQRRRAEAAYEDTGEMAEQHRRDEGGQRRRPEAAYEDTGEMVRHTETVVTRRETTTMRSGDHEGYRGAQSGAESGAYRGDGGKSSFGDRLSKMRRSRDDESEEYGARQQADSLLAGLQAEPGRQDDWRDGETMMVPQQRHGRHGYDPGDEARGGRHSRGGEPQSGGWHSEERSAELRMGMRQSRGGPVDGWNDEEPVTGSRWGGESSRRRGRHYDEEAAPAAEPTRAISAYEADPQPRWRDYQKPSAAGGSYMDQYYGGGKHSERR